nr:hypothetical protein CFP56_69056 [Quercus suber]
MLLYTRRDSRDLCRSCSEYHAVRVRLRDGSDVIRSDQAVICVVCHGIRSKGCLPTSAGAAKDHTTYSPPKTC